MGLLVVPTAPILPEGNRVHPPRTSPARCSSSSSDPSPRSSSPVGELMTRRLALSSITLRPVAKAYRRCTCGVRIDPSQGVGFRSTRRCRDSLTAIARNSESIVGDGPEPGLERGPDCPARLVSPFDSPVRAATGLLDPRTSRTHRRERETRRWNSASSSRRKMRRSQDSNSDRTVLLAPSHWRSTSLRGLRLVCSTPGRLASSSSTA